MDWKALLKDKRVWVGAAGAVGLGLVAVIRKSKATGPATGTTSSGGTAATTAASAGTGNADTTGTDIASFLSNYSGSLQGQLNDFGSQLTDTLSALRGGGITTPTGGTGTPTPAGTVAYGGYTRNADGTYSVPIGGGTNWADLQQSLAGVNLNADIATLMNLNPGITGDVSNFKDSGGNWQNVFRNPVTVKVPVLRPPAS